MPTNAPVTRQAVHQVDALGWVVPPWGCPAEMKKTIPSMVRMAPDSSRPPMRWLVRATPKGRARTRLSAVIDWTTTSEARSRAMAWTTHPVACSAAPANQTGRCRMWRRKRASSSSVAMVPFCWSTVPKAKSTAARMARPTPMAN